MKKIALLFPGQGTQVCGMGKDFIDKYSIAKETYKNASEILGRDIEKLCFESSDSTLKNTVNAQTAIFTTSVAMYRVYKEEIGIEPAYLAGHSLGEYIALTCGGAISFEDAVKLVNARGNIMQRANQGKMLAVSRIGVSELESLIYELNRDNIVSIACYNSTNQNVVSVNDRSSEFVIDKLTSVGANVKELQVSAGFHSIMMKEAAEELSAELEKYEFKKPKSDIISNVTAMPYISAEEIKIRLYQHMINPVRWKDTIKYLVDNNVECAVEIGMGHVLKSLASKSSIKLPVISLNNPEDFGNIRNTIGSLDSEKTRLIKKFVKEAISAPNRSNLDNSEYEKKVQTNCKKMKEIYSNIMENEHRVETHDFKVIFNLLKEVFQGKSLPEEEQKVIFNEFISDFNKLNINFQNILMGEI